MNLGERCYGRDRILFELPRHLLLLNVFHELLLLFVILAHPCDTVEIGCHLLDFKELLLLLAPPSRDHALKGIEGDAELSW